MPYSLESTAIYWNLNDGFDDLISSLLFNVHKFLALNKTVFKGIQTGVHSEGYNYLKMQKVN